MTRLNKLTVLAAAVALSVGLSACGGGGGSTDTSMMPSPQDQVAELQAQIAALRTQLGLAPSDDIGASITELQNTLAALQKQVDDAQADADKAAAAAAAKDAMALFDGIDETTTDLTVGVTTVTDEHGGGMASVATTGLTPGVAGANTAKSAEPMLGMWQGTMLTDTNDADASSTVVVYTDVEAAKAVPFDDVHTLANDVLAIDADADADDHVKLISASAFMHSGRMVHDPDPDDTGETIRIRGMFNGAAGEYRCAEGGTAGACASIESSMGVRLAGTWFFDPDSGAMAMQADTEYAYFGWWLNKGTTEGVEAGAFHGMTGGTALVAADFTALGGTATYSGSAAGKYAINPGLSAASGGHWTADATLTADFGSELTEGMISGTVDNFMAGGEMMDWSVSLGETDLASTTGTFDSSTNAGSDTVGDDVVWTIGGVAGAEAGAWMGALREAGDNNVPTLATGQFSATHGSVGHMVGAFGANLDE